jgi:hypothetical protein
VFEIVCKYLMLIAGDGRSGELLVEAAQLPEVKALKKGG